MVNGVRTMGMFAELNPVNAGFLFMMSDICYTYILYSPEFDKIYIGQTKDLQKKLAAHNSGKSHSTKSYVPWELVYYEEYASRSQAMKREKELKSH